MRIEARDIVAGYGRTMVLQGVSLDAPPGEFLALIGPNGSGKSTLLRVLARSLAPRSGRVLFDGMQADRLSSRDVARRLAFVPQFEPTVFDFTVRETVLMGRHPHLRGLEGERESDFAAATRAMAATNVLHLSDRPITALSGGEHRRVLVARALAQEAPTLILDEPTAHLDITHQTDLLASLRRLAHREGVAVLAALHDLNMAAEFADRIALLASGRLEACGPPKEVLTGEAIERAYEVPVHVGRNPTTGRPWVLPKAQPDIDLEGDLCIHVICGGGTGSEVMAGLKRLGYAVTAGVINRMDTDAEAATALGIPHVTEAPFSAIGPEARSACSAMLSTSDAVLITPVPFGRGNLANLEMASEALSSQKPVFVIAGADLEARDFTRGAATALWHQMNSTGARAVASLKEAEAALRDLRYAASCSVAAPGAQRGDPA